MRLAVLALLLAACGPPDGPDLHGNQILDGGTHDGASAASADGAITPGADLASAPDLAQAAGSLVPARNGSSNGSGGGATGGIAVRTVGAITYRLIVPAGYSDATKTPLLVVFSGTEGGATMAQNLVSLATPVPKSGTWIRAVLDGVTYNGNGDAGAMVLDELRAKYNVDNDRTYLIGESAGTTAAFELGFHLRQSYFAAYWANDVSAVNADGPMQTAAQLGFAPWGQVGPGGATALANAIATNMKAAGYQTDATTPYAGAGAGTHGSPDQFIAALAWLDGKAR